MELVIKLLIVINLILILLSMIINFIINIQIFKCNKERKKLIKELEKMKYCCRENPDGIIEVC